MDEFNLDYTKIGLDDLDLIIINISEENWKDIKYLQSARDCIKNNKCARFRLKMDNGNLSTELTQHMALITLNCRITELENTNV